MGSCFLRNIKTAKLNSIDWKKIDDADKFMDMVIESENASLSDAYFDGAESKLLHIALKYLDKSFLGNKDVAFIFELNKDNIELLISGTEKIIVECLGAMKSGSLEEKTNIFKEIGWHDENQSLDSFIDCLTYLFKLLIDTRNILLKYPEHSIICMISY